MYITHVDGAYDGDAFFPEVHWEQWRIVAETPGAPGTAGTRSWITRKDA